MCIWHNCCSWYWDHYQQKCLLGHVEKLVNATIHEQRKTGIDRAPPHWRMDVGRYLNCHPLGWWISCETAKDNMTTPFTDCHNGYDGINVKDSVYVHPLPVMLSELRKYITTAIRNVTQDTCERVWHEWDHHLDTCCITCGITLSVSEISSRISNLPLSHYKKMFYLC